MPDTVYHFVPSRTRTHIARWDNIKREWRVACGLVPARGAQVYLDKPLCATCDRLTRQTTKEDVHVIKENRGR